MGIYQKKRKRKKKCKIIRFSDIFSMKKTMHDLQLAHCKIYFNLTEHF